MMSSVLSPLLMLLSFSPVVTVGGSQEKATPRGMEATTLQESAVSAAEFVLTGLESISAEDATGASWIQAAARKNARARAAQQSEGAALPSVHVTYLEVQRVDTKNMGFPSYFSVKANLRLDAEHGLVDAANFFEGLTETFDHQNGKLAVQVQSMSLDPVRKSIDIRGLEVQLSAAPIAPTTHLLRPLTEVGRLVSLDDTLVSEIKLTPTSRRTSKTGVTQLLDLQLGGEDDRLTAKTCGAFLQRIARGDSPIAITRFSIGSTRAENQTTERWKLKATLFLGTNTE